MRKVFWAILVPLIAVVIFLFLSLIDGFHSLLGPPVRREIQVTLAHWTMVLMIGPAIVMYALGRLAFWRHRPQRGLTFLETSSVMFAFFIGAFYAAAAAARDPLQIGLCLVVMAVWIGWYERRTASAAWRRPGLVAIVFATWLMIRLIAA